MHQVESDNRRQDGTPEIARKYGNTLISTLRMIYGAQFAPGFPPTVTLSEALERLDKRSLAEVRKDHDDGKLVAKIKRYC